MVITSSTGKKCPNHGCRDDLKAVDVNLTAFPIEKEKHGGSRRELMEGCFSCGYVDIKITNLRAEELARLCEDYFPFRLNSKGNNDGSRANEKRSRFFNAYEKATNAN